MREVRSLREGVAASPAQAIGRLRGVRIGLRPKAGASSGDDVLTAAASSTRTAQPHHGPSPAVGRTLAALIRAVFQRSEPRFEPSQPLFQVLICPGPGWRGQPREAIGDIGYEARCFIREESNRRDAGV